MTKYRRIISNGIVGLFLFFGCWVPSYAQQSLLNDESLVVSTNALIYQDSKVGIRSTPISSAILYVKGNAVIGSNPNTSKSTIIANVIEYNAVSSSSATIEWGLSNFQHITVSDDITLSFEAPPTPKHLILHITRQGTGNVTLPSTLTWPQNATPNFAASAADAAGRTVEDIIGMYYDGSTYLGAGSLDFR